MDLEGHGQAEPQAAPLGFPIDRSSTPSQISECRSNASQPVQIVNGTSDDVYTPTVSDSPLVSKLSKKGQKSESIHLGNDPSTLEPDPSFEDSVRKANELIAAIKSNSFYGLGIAVIVHNKDVPDSIAYNESLSESENKRRGKLKPLHGIERGTKKLSDRFANLGILPIQVENPRKKDLKKILDIFSSENISTQSEPCLFLYITGHGARLTFFLKDGSMSYDSVYDRVSSDNTPCFKYRWFIFDCCRTCRIDNASLFPDEDGTVSREPNIKRDGDCMLFATTDGNQAFGPGDGVSFMTHKACDLLTKNIPFSKFVIKLRKYLKGKGQNLESRSTADIDINLSTERNKKMQPKITRMESGQIYLDITVDVFQPIATNSTGSRYEHCEVQLLNQTRKKLYIVNSVSNELCKELCTEVQLKCVLPTVDRGHNQSAKVQIRTHYSGELTLSSDQVTVEIPTLIGPICNDIEINRHPVDPSIDIKWTYPYEQEFDPYLDLLEFEVTLETIDSNNQSIGDPRSITIDKSEQRVCLPVRNLFACDSVLVKVSAKRSDNAIIEGVAFSEEIPKAKPELIVGTCTTEVQYMLNSSLKIEWRLDLVDPNIVAYEITAENKDGEKSIKTYDANQEGIYSVNFPVSLKLLSKGDRLKVFVEAKRQRGENTRSEEHVVSIKRGWYTTGSRCLFCLTSIVTIFLWFLFISNSVSFEIDQNGMKSYVTNNVIILDKINSKTILNYFLYIEGWVVIQTDNHEQDVAVYCSGYSHSQIDNSRQIKYLLPNMSYHEVNQSLLPGNYSLPFGSVQHATAFYLGSGSIMSVYICPYSTNVSFNIIFLDDYEQLRRFVRNSSDFNRDSLLSNTSINTTSSHCKNHTVYNATQSSFVFTVIETFVPLNFSLFDGYISQVFYNATLLNITDRHNRISGGMMKNKIYSNIGSTLMCIAPNTTKFVEMESYLNEHFNELGASLLVPPLFTITGAVFLWFCIVVCCRTCQSNATRHHGYERINN